MKMFIGAIFPPVKLSNRFLAFWMILERCKCLVSSACRRALASSVDISMISLNRRELASDMHPASLSLCWTSDENHFSPAAVASSSLEKWIWNLRNFNDAELFYRSLSSSVFRLRTLLANVSFRWLWSRQSLNTNEFAFWAFLPFGWE